MTLFLCFSRQKIGQLLSNRTTVIVWLYTTWHVLSNENERKCLRIRTPVYKDCVMTSIRLIPYTFPYRILVQVYKIRIFSWHTLTYSDHYTDLIPHATSFLVRLCVLTVYHLSKWPYTDNFIQCQLFDRTVKRWKSQIVWNFSFSIKFEKFCSCTPVIEKRNEEMGEGREEGRNEVGRQGGGEGARERRKDLKVAERTKDGRKRAHLKSVVAQDRSWIAIEWLVVLNARISKWRRFLNAPQTRNSTWFQQQLGNWHRVFNLSFLELTIWS